MIKECEDDIFSLPVDAIINPVNCVGVMGAGLALEFKKRYPINYSAYVAMCSNGALVPGDLFTTKISEIGVKFIINFPTKNHYKNPSRINYIKKGLVALKEFVEISHIKSIAMPALGCGLGGLSYDKVKSAVEKEFSESDTVIYLIKPK